MDIIKGLARLQFNIETLSAAAEAAGDPHLTLLKRCHHQIAQFVQSPETIDVALLEQLALDLSLRSRSRDQLPEQDYDLIVVGIRLLARMRQSEIEQSYGPSSPHVLQESREDPLEASETPTEKVKNNALA